MNQAIQGAIAFGVMAYAFLVNFRRRILFEEEERLAEKNSALWREGMLENRIEALEKQAKPAE